MQRYFRCRIYQAGNVTRDILHLWSLFDSKTQFIPGNFDYKDCINIFVYLFTGNWIEKLKKRRGNEGGKDFRISRFPRASTRGREHGYLSARFSAFFSTYWWLSCFLLVNEDFVRRGLMEG